MALDIEVGLGPGHTVLDWNPAPLPKRGRSPLPNFRPMSIVAKRLHGSRWPWIKMALDTEVGLGSGYIVLDWNPAPLPKKGAESPPQFSAHFYCGQTDGCIKMPLGMEVGLSPGEFVLDGDPALLPQQGHSPSPILMVEVENFEIAPEVGALPAIANFVVLDKQIILVKTRSESL